MPPPTINPPYMVSPLNRLLPPGAFTKAASSSGFSSQWKSLAPMRPQSAAVSVRLPACSCGCTTTCSVFGSASRCFCLERQASPASSAAPASPPRKLPVPLSRKPCGSAVASLKCSSRYSPFQPSTKPSSPWPISSPAVAGAPMVTVRVVVFSRPCAAFRRSSRPSVQLAATKASATKKPKLLMNFRKGRSSPVRSSSAW